MISQTMSSPPIVELEPFRPRWPFIGGDLQTLRSHILPGGRRPPEPDYERVDLPLADGTGDRLVGSLSGLDTAASNAPLVVLIHGLSGSQDSPYMRTTALELSRRGFPVLRLNLRGAGLSGATCGREYNAGLTDDLAQAIAALPDRLKDRPTAALAFSLGANMLLKWLGECGSNAPLIAAGSVSAPIDLAATSRSMRRRRNRPYQNALLRDFSRQCARPGAAITESERAAIQSARDFYEIDTDFIAPRHGFDSADHYYQVCMALPYLAAIRIPTMVIHALNDPIVPSEAYRRYPWSDNPWLIPGLCRDGGHVGFHDVSGRWFIRQIERLLTTIVGPVAPRY